MAVRHRNHLGVMSKSPIFLGGESHKEIVADFADPSMEVYGEHSRKRLNEVCMLWGGNADNDAFLVFRGGGIARPDGDEIFFRIFLDSHNQNAHINHITNGYYTEDTNMDGKVIYQGPNNDLTTIFYNIIQHPNNVFFNENFYVVEQLPN